MVTHHGFTKKKKRNGIHRSPEQQAPKGREEEHREHGRARERLGLVAAADATPAAAALGAQRVMFKPAAGEVRA